MLQDRKIMISSSIPQLKRHQPTPQKNPMGMKCILFSTTKMEKKLKLGGPVRPSNIFSTSRGDMQIRVPKMLQNTKQ